MMYYNYNPYLLYLQKNDIFFYRNGGLIYKGKSGVISDAITLGRKAFKKASGLFRKKSGKASTKVTEAATKAATKTDGLELYKYIKSKSDEIKNSITKKSEHLLDIADEATAYKMLETSHREGAAIDYLNLQEGIKKLDTMSFEELIKFRTYYEDLFKHIKNGKDILDKVNLAIKKAVKKEFSNGIPTSETSKTSETPKKKHKLKTALKITAPIIGFGIADYATDNRLSNIISEKAAYPVAKTLYSVGKGAVNMITGFAKGLVGMDYGKKDLDSNSEDNILVVTPEEQPVSSSVVSQTLERILNESSNP